NRIPVALITGRSGCCSATVIHWAMRSANSDGEGILIPVAPCTCPRRSSKNLRTPPTTTLWLTRVTSDFSGGLSKSWLTEGMFRRTLDIVDSAGIVIRTRGRGPGDRSQGEGRPLGPLDLP